MKTQHQTYHSSVCCTVSPFLFFCSIAQNILYHIYISTGKFILVFSISVFGFTMKRYTFVNSDIRIISEQINGTHTYQQHMYLSQRFELLFAGANNLLTVIK